MSEWQEKNLGEFIDVINGFAFKSENFINEPNENALPIIKIKNVANGDTHVNGSQYHYYTNNLSKYVVESGDVLIALTGNHPQAKSQVVGMASRFKLKSKALLNQRVAKVIAKDEKRLGLDFIYFFLKDPNTHQYLASQSSGSANQANISKADIESIPFFLPSEVEQKSIVSILSSLDDKIDLLHSQNKTLEDMTETLFRQWFVEEAGDWDEGKLGDFIEIQRGISYSGNTLGKPGEGLPMHSLNSINVDGDYKYDGIKSFIGVAKESQILKPGDLLIINTDMTPDNRIIGWPIFVPDKFEKSVCTHHLYRVGLSSNKITKLYLYFLLRSREYRDELANASNGTTVSMLARGAIDNIRLKVPPRNKIAEFEVHAKVYMSKRLLNQYQIESLQKLRDSLLPKLMSGEVRVMK